MREMETHVVENKALLLGDNHFETSSINLTAGQEIKEGAFLARSGNAFILVTDLDPEEGQEPCAIMPVTMKNSGTAAAVQSLRACLDGKVRADLLHVNGTPATKANIDLIRKYGFVPIYTTDISRLDNQ
jgi:hypothetical protein